MKVLHIIASIDETTGGPARSVPQTCIELAKLGVEIEIICQPSTNPVKIPKMKNLSVRFLNSKALKNYGKTLNNKDIAIIHLQHIWLPYIHIMAAAARKAHIPYIITPRGMLEPWIMNRNPLKKKLAMLLYQHKDLKRARVIHTTCEQEKDNIQAIGYTNKIKVIPNGIDLSKIPEPKISYDCKKMVFLSRIHEKKGIENLLDAWKEIANNKWMLEIAGEGEGNYVAKLKHKIKSEQIKNVTFVGGKYGMDKWDFIRSADVFVLPTYSENFGIVVAEALAVGVPVITTTGTPWEELKTNHCGWWIDLNIEDITHSIQDAIMTSPELLKNMGERGKKLIKNNYDIKTVAQQLKVMYINTLVIPQQL